MRTFKASRNKSHAPDADGKPLCGREGSTGEGYVTCKRCVEKMSVKKEKEAKTIVGRRCSCGHPVSAHMSTSNGGCKYDCPCTRNKRGALDSLEPRRTP
jgi:hypothetical protein